MYQTQDKLASIALFKGNTGINTTVINKTLLKCFLMCSYFHIPKDVLKKHIPVRAGVRQTAVLKVLIIVMGKPGITSTYITTNCAVRVATVRYSLAYLVELGYIKQIGKPRFIVPFQKYKVDKGYNITTKGENALSMMLDFD